MATGDRTIQAGIAEGDGAAHSPGGPPPEADQEWTVPPSMAPGSEWAENVDKPKVHDSPPKEEIYPDWKPGDPHPSNVVSDEEGTEEDADEDD